jgi:uncharacterized protein involved in outer membrane biogenesis
MVLSPRSRATLRTTLKWTGIVLGSVVVVVLLALLLIDWNALKGPIERMASARSGRVVKIDGSLDVHVWSWTPRAVLEGLTIGNPPWDPSRPMIHVDRVNVQMKLLPLLKGDVILPRVELVHPVVYLHRDPSGRANWTFESTQPSNAPAGRPPKLPVVRDFLIQSGQLSVRDEILKLKVEGTVQAHEQGSKDDPHAFRIQGKGTINDQPFDMRVAGGPLINLDPDRPYPFDMQVDAGEVHVTSNGTVKKPFDLGKLQFNVHAKGGDLADVYYLTHLAMPNTPPFELSANIDRNLKVIKVTKLAGTLGKSDLSGELTVDASRKRPTLTGDLVSKQLLLSDLAASFGGKPATGGTLQRQDEKPKPSKKGAAEPAPANPNARLFPTARLQVNRVRAMDADVRFRGQSVRAGSLPLKEVAFNVKLDDGLLALAPFEFTMPQGKLSGTARIDARGKVPQTRVDVRLKDIQLDQLKSKKPGSQPPLGGIMQARAVLEGHGDSVHDLMADADGRVSVILPHGQVNAAFAELTGINVARGVGLLLKGSDDKAEIRCGVAQFGVKDGTMRAENVVFDTQDVRITGQGDVRLGPEELDLAIKGEPKKLRLARVRTPIEINGHLRKPSIGIDAGKTAKQGAIATALGAVLTPFAAVVAFVDPGLAKDENCAALLQTAENTKPKPDAPVTNDVSKSASAAPPPPAKRR